MHKCSLCLKIVEGDVPEFESHLFRGHKMSLKEIFVVRTKHNNVIPLCVCGLCSDRPYFYRGKFSKYALGHNTFEFREGAYLEKFGSPKCLHCDNVVGFHRGIPRQFCSSVCSGLHNGGFTQKETRAKIKEVVLEKYGVDNVSKLDEVKGKISKQNTGNGGWHHSEQTLKHLSDEARKLWQNPEFRAKVIPQFSEIRKRNWQNPVYRQTILQGNLSGKHSKLHQTISERLCLKALGFESERVIFRYRVDEINFDKKVIVEINGDYIHANPAKFKSDDLIILRSSRYIAQDKWNYDQKRKEALEALGFKVFVIWQSDDLDKKKLELYQLLGIQ